MTSLAKKLRLQPGQRILILNAPEGFVDALRPLPEDTELVDPSEAETEKVSCDYVHLFVRNNEQYDTLGSTATGAVTYDGILWVSYPKKSGGVETDLSRDVMWDLLAEVGWRPVAQVSIDEVWSAVRFRPKEAVGT